MTAAIATIAAAILGSIGSFFAWKSSAIRQRRQAEEDIAKEAELSEAKKDEIRAAVYSNDDEKFNQILNHLMKD